MSRRFLSREERILSERNLALMEQDEKDFGYQLKSAKLLLDEGLEFKYRKEKEAIEGHIKRLSLELKELELRRSVTEDQIKNGVETLNKENETTEI